MPKLKKHYGGSSWKSFIVIPEKQWFLNQRLILTRQNLNNTTLPTDKSGRSIELTKSHLLGLLHHYYPKNTKFNAIHKKVQNIFTNDFYVAESVLVDIIEDLNAKQLSTISEIDNFILNVLEKKPVDDKPVVWEERAVKPLKKILGKAKTHKNFHEVVKNLMTVTRKYKKQKASIQSMSY